MRKVEGKNKHAKALKRFAHEAMHSQISGVALFVFREGQETQVFKSGRTPGFAVEVQQAPALDSDGLATPEGP